MDWWLISFFLGALLSLFLPIVPSLFYVVLTLVLAAVVYFSRKTRKLTLMLLGASWMLWHGWVYQVGFDTIEQRIVNQLSRKIVVTGVIDSIVTANDTRQRFNFVIDSFANQQLEQKINLRLSWEDAPVIKQGQIWQLTVKIKPAHGLANIGSFSYQAWLRQHQLHATGYVVNTASNHIVNNNISWRQAYFDKLSSQIKQMAFSPLILALTFGERGQLTKADWQVLQRTATQHLIAISGLHLGIIAGFSYLFFQLLLKRLPLDKWCSVTITRRLLKTNQHYLTVTLTLAFIYFYAVLAGESVATQRALLMVTIFWLAKLSGIHLSLARWLSLTLFFITVLTPFSLFSASFWLSFYAVSCIFALLWRFTAQISASKMYAVTRFDKIIAWSKALLSLQFGLIIFMLPITLLFNHQFSFVAIPANLFAVPLMSVTAIPLSLLSVLTLPISESLSLFFSYLSSQSLAVLWQWLVWLSEVPSAYIALSHLWYYLAVMLVVWLMLRCFISLPPTYHYFYGLLMIISCLAYSHFQENEKNHWRVNVMDVGQGLAVIVEANHQVLIYDTGASFISGFSMADAVLVPYLRYQGYQAIDTLIISHDDNDHAGGLVLLSDAFAIKQLIYNQEVNANSCLQGRAIHWQFLTIEMLSPTMRVGQDNDDSCVVRISDGRRRVLLTGDISAKLEQQLINSSNSSPKLASDYLIAPHHGSKSSSSLAFINAVSPSVAIFSAGFLNRWQMPVSTIVARYHNLSIKTYNTASDGMIRIDISSDTAKVSSYRQQIFPFWFAN